MLLVAAALSTSGSAACHRTEGAAGGATVEPLPANPKGSLYDDPARAALDAGAVEPPADAAAADAGHDARAADAGPADAPPPTLPIRRPLPANPKGSHYARDAGPRPKGDPGF